MSHLFASLGVIGKTCSAVVQRVHKHQRHCASSATRHHVLAKVDHVRVGFPHLEHRLDLVLESKVQCLRRKVTNAVGQIAAPEWQNACTTRTQTKHHILNGKIMSTLVLLRYQNFGCRSVSAGFERKSCGFGFGFLDKHIRLLVFNVTGHRRRETKNTQCLGTFQSDPWRHLGTRASSRRHGWSSGGQYRARQWWPGDNPHLRVIPRGQADGRNKQVHPAELIEVHHDAIVRL